MNRLRIDTELYKRLISLPSKISGYDEAEAADNFADNIEGAERSCRNLEFILSDLQNAINSADYAVYDKEIERGVESMEQYITSLSELEEEVASLKNYLAGSIKAVAEITEPSRFVVTALSEEIERVLDETSDRYQIMSLGYNDGKYALLFGNDEESIEEEPFVFAVGREDEYEEVRRFVETFLDLEDPDEE